MMEVNIDSTEISKLFRELAARFGNDRPLQIASDIIAQSVQYNFVAGGRPGRWPPLKYRNGQPLRDTGRLMNSINARVVGGRGLVSTSVRYAATQNYGARKGQYGIKQVTVPAHTRRRGGTSYNVRSHKRKQALPWGDIPQREFMVVQNEDVLEIERVLRRLVEG